MYEKRIARQAAADFQHGNSGYTNHGCRCQVCVDGRALHNKKTEARLRDATRPFAHRSGFQWTGPEIELALRDDLPISAIARMIGRSYSAVATMRMQAKADPRYARLAGV